MPATKNTTASLGVTTAPPPGTMRRLAPQRKEKADVKEGAAASEAVDSIPIDIAESESSFEEEDGDGGSEVNITKNVADWTLRDNHENEEDDGSSGKDGEEADREYHGEIESVCSNNSNNLNVTKETEEDSDSEEEGEDIFNIITEEEVSLNPPPPTSPLLLVNLEGLCGCPPENMEEKLVMERQILEVLLGSKEQPEDEGDEGKKEREDDGEKYAVKEGGDVGTNELLGDGLSLDFDERAIELFDCKLARHVDSSYPVAISLLAEGEGPNKTEEGGTNSERVKEREVTPYTVVPYPEFLSARNSSATRSTMRIWK